MKPDGVDTAAPLEALGAEPVIEAPAGQEELPQMAPPTSQPEEAAKPQEPQPATQTAPPAPKEGNGKPADPKSKTKGPIKTRPGTAGAKTTGTTGPGARPGVGQNRLVNGAQKPLANGVAKKATAATAPEKKKPTTTTLKRPVGPSAAAAARPPTKVADKKPVGVPRPATAPSGTKTGATAAATPNKKVSTAPVNGVKARPKTTAPRPASAVPSKPSSAAAPTKTDRPTVPRTTRPAGVLPAPRPAPTTAAAKPGAASARLTTSRAGTTAPSAGRSTAAQPTKTTAPAKRDVSRPTTVPPKKTAVAPTRPPATKPSKIEAPKPAAAARADPAAKRPAASGKAADTKTSARPKLQEAGKTPAPGDVKASPRASGPRPGLTKTPTATSKRQVGSSAPLAVKRGPKPTQPVQPLAASGEPAKKSQSPKSSAAATGATLAAAAAAAAAVAMAAAEPLAPMESEQVPVFQEGEEMMTPSLPPVPAAVEVKAAGLLTQQPDVPATVVPLLDPTTFFHLSSPAGPASLPLEAQGLPPVSAGAPESLLGDEREQEVEDGKEVPVPVAAAEPKPEPLAAVHSDLHAAATLSSLPQEREETVEKAEEENNEDEEEEEREGSQQVSVSDMSGTQPTEESRPGSAGLAGSVWRGGALMSELDSEEVSGSQQGASELSAPGVLEGTESMDDLGDASLKGADAGSPDIDTVPDIPANDEEEDDDDDQVYDMEVGSERAEDVRRVRREGEEEEEDDEDVEMASEGVTESGLESYGNADEDDFAEDDRLDNLNRAQPPPPLLPTALPTQWSQTNPFADPWAHPSQPAANLLASPSDPWPADHETPTQSPAQVWLELSTATLAPQPGDPFAHLQALPLSMASKPQPAPAEQAAPKAMLAPPTRGMSQSSTLSGTELAAQSSSDTSTPEELRDYNSSSGVESRSEGKQQQQQQQEQQKAPGPALQPDLEQDLGIHLERGDGEEEAETLPADEVLGGPPTAPMSAPSSSSTSGDEASDTEGEMRINEPEGQGIDNVAFEAKPGAQNLPALEEREGDGDGEEGGDTPQSANSVASYAFDCTNSNSNSNAHSTAESGGKSPGIFSLENEDQLPEEAKDPSLIKELTLPAATNVDLVLGAPVDLLPLGQVDEAPLNPDEQQYMLCGKPGAELGDQSAAGGPLAQDAGLLPLSHAGDAPDSQPPYYSAICEKTDTVLSGNV